MAPSSAASSTQRAPEAAAVSAALRTWNFASYVSQMRRERERERLGDEIKGVPKVWEKKAR